MAETFRLTGSRELSAALEELGKAAERRVLTRVAKKNLEPFVEKAQGLAPVDEGFTRDSIVIGTKLTDRAKRADRKEPRNGVRVFAGTAARNAVPREFGAVWKDGTVLKAQPFMRPAWEASKDGMLASVQSDLMDEIDKAAARAARKKARR